MLTESFASAIVVRLKIEDREDVDAADNEEPFPDVLYDLVGDFTTQSEHGSG